MSDQNKNDELQDDDLEQAAGGCYFYDPSNPKIDDPAFDYPTPEQPGGGPGMPAPPVDKIPGVIKI